VAEPPPKSKMGVAETTPVWPEGGFGHPRPAGLGVARPPLRAKP